MTYLAVALLAATLAVATACPKQTELASNANGNGTRDGCGRSHRHAAAGNPR